MKIVAEPAESTPPSAPITAEAEADASVRHAASIVPDSARRAESTGCDSSELVGSTSPQATERARSAAGTAASRPKGRFGEYI
jgi:hypothetical protein